MTSLSNSHAALEKNDEPLSDMVLSENQIYENASTTNGSEEDHQKPDLTKAVGPDLFNHKFKSQYHV